MKSISILGCGWLGLPLGKFLASQNFMVKGSSTQEEKIKIVREAGIEPYLLLFEPQQNNDPDNFFHSDILILNLPPRNPEFYLDQLSVIRDLAKDHIRHVIFISSTGVYPANNNEVTEVDADLNCVSRSGVSLLAAENIFSGSAYFQTTVLRFGGLYGPGRHPGNFLAGKKDLSGANNPVNMIHLDDCIGVIESIIRQNIWGEVFNACSPTTETRKTFYQRAAGELMITLPEFNEMQSPYKKVNSDKLIRMTGYQFEY